MRLFYRYASSSGKEVYSPDGAQDKGHRGDCGWLNPQSTERFSSLLDLSKMTNKDCIRFSRGVCLEYGNIRDMWYMLEARGGKHRRGDTEIVYA